MSSSDALKQHYTSILDRIAQACVRVGRSADEVTLVAVSKTFPLEDIRALQALGHRDFGENKVQEFKEKADSLPGRASGGSVVWHAIGHLQRNKVRDVVPRADLFHALDSVRLASEIQRRCETAGRTFDCLVQVNVSGEESKFGLDPAEVGPFLEALKPFDRICPVGLMTLAAPAPSPELVRPQFRLLRDLRRELAHSSPALQLLSMGMSGDFEVAIEEGATHVRIGSAIFGDRSSI